MLTLGAGRGVLGKEECFFGGGDGTEKATGYCLQEDLVGRKHLVYSARAIIHY